MKITPIKFNIPFRGEKDEDQPLSPALREVFADSSVSKSKQKLLWELSEVPDFYKASKGLSKDEFIQLADFVQNQDTNILEMALKGDVRIIDKEMDDDGKSFFTFAPLAKRNSENPEKDKKGVIDFIKEHPIFKIISDALKIYKENNVYPEFIPYQVEKDVKGNTVYNSVNPIEAHTNMILNAMFTGSAFGQDNAVILFKDTIKGKNDFDVNYRPIKPSSIEPIYPVEPECIKFLLSVPGLDNKIKNSVYELSKIPYFNNLVSSTHPNILAQLANLDVSTNNLLARLFKGDVTIGICNPKTQNEVERPVIDIGKLLYDRKNGKIPKTDLLSILSENTLAIETCLLYSNLDDEIKNEKVKYIIFSKNNEGLIGNVVTASNNSRKFLLNNNHPIAKKISEFVEKVPLKQISINFEKTNKYNFDN